MNDSGVIQQRAKCAGWFTTTGAIVPRTLPERRQVMSEHTPSTKGEGFSDWVECSCGWRSHSYWDGVDFAMDEWKRHEGASDE